MRWEKKNCMIQQISSRNQTNRYSANTKIRFCFLKIYIYIYIYEISGNFERERWKKEITGGGIWEWGEGCVEATASRVMAEESEFVRVNSARQPRVASGSGIFGRRFSLILSLSTLVPKKIMSKTKYF